MRRRLEKRKTVDKEETASRGKDGFTATKCAVVLTSFLAAASCGDVHNISYFPETKNKSELCTEENITLETQSKEITVNVGNTFMFSNGYRMTLLDVEAETQIALFMLKDPEGNEIRNVDMEEGIGYVIEFPDGNVTVAACSVRAGYKFGESSATVRADVDMGPYEEPVIPDEPPCLGTLEVQSAVWHYNSELASASQQIDSYYCSDVLVREPSNFDPPVEVVSDASGNVLGLPHGRYSVIVLGEIYMLADISRDKVTIAKEAMGATLEIGQSFTVDGLTFWLDDIEAHGDVTALLISVWDANGNLLRRGRVEPGQTATFNIGGSDYHFHVYSIGAGYTFGTLWADVAIFSQVHEIRDGDRFETENGMYTFEMEWTAGNELRRWEFNIWSP